jgi:signal transduction histidine kinase
MTENDDALRFPDAPRAALDRALRDLVDHAQKVLETQARTAHVLRRSPVGRSGERSWSLVPLAKDAKQPGRRTLASLGLSRATLDEAAASGETVALPTVGGGTTSGYGPSPASGRRIAVPIQGPTSVDSLIILSRPESSPGFGPFDLELTDLVSRHASLALQLAAARVDRQRMQLADDRARIARDLHDLVIQQIYAAGLELQTAIGLSNDPVLIDRVSHAVDALDASIVQIRNIVFALSAAPAEGDIALRYKLFDLANEYSGGLSSTPSVSFTGAVDVLVRNGLADDVVAVARESLTNVVKHSRAKHASLHVSIVGDDVVLEVTDDGVGMGGSSRRSGLANIERRAVDRGGRFELRSDSHGTRLRWRAPLESTPRER